MDRLVQVARLATVCAFIIAACSSADSQVEQLAPAQSLSVSAKEVRGGGRTVYRWATYWGSYDRDFFTQQDVQIEAHNLSRLTAKILIDFYFVGAPDRQSAPRKLFSKRTFTIEVPPGYQNRVSIGSEVLRSNEQRYVTLGEQYNSGYHLIGWLLQARVPGEAKPFAYASSEPAWIERLDWFDTALAEFYREAPEARTNPVQSPTVRHAPTATASGAAPSIGSPAPTVEPASYVVTTADVPLRLEYGNVIINRGTRLRVVKRDASTVYVQFGATVIPLSANLVR